MRISAFLTSCMVTLLLAGCGQSGALYLPHTNPPTTAQASSPALASS